jgi:SNF2 family DNA or RNA helicase
MKTKLLPTQTLDVQRLIERTDLPNYSMPGTGKTLTTVAAIEEMCLTGGVIVAPPIAVPMWKEVLEYELGATASILKKVSENPADHNGSDFLIMTYQMATEHKFDILAARQSPMQALVLDESHYLKTVDSKRTKAVFGPTCDGQFGLYMNSHYCFTLTGTPIERHANDLWSQLRALQPDALNRHGVLTYADFVQRFTYSQMKQFNKRMAPKMTVVSSRNLDYLNRILYEDIGVIRRTMDEVAKDMPEVTFRNIACECKLDAQTTRYLRKKTVRQIGEALLMGDDEAMAARRLLGLAKVQAVTQYVMDSAAQGAILLGYWHTDFGTAVVHALKEAGIKAERIGGGMDAETVQNHVRGFNTGEVRVIVGQIAAMGVSLNLQAGCNHVIIGEDDWSPAKIEQFYKRVWRLGQKNHVQVDFCVADTVVDDAISSIRHNKSAGVERMLAQQSQIA